MLATLEMRDTEVTETDPWKGYYGLLRIQELMQANGSPDAQFQATLKLVNAACNLPDRVNSLPNSRKMSAAHAAFFALPLAEQRRIFNGWPADPEVVSRADVQRVALDNSEPQRVLSVEARFEAGRCEIRGDVYHWLCPSMLPVHLQIQEGTTRIEALRYLWAMSFMVRDHWQEMIDPNWGGFHFTVKEKNGTPDSATDPRKLGSNGDREAIRPTAV